MKWLKSMITLVLGLLYGCRSGLTQSICTEAELNQYPFETEWRESCEAVSGASPDTIDASMCELAECHRVINKYKFAAFPECTDGGKTLADTIHARFDPVLDEFASTCYTECSVSEAESFYVSHDPVQMQELARECVEIEKKNNDQAQIARINIEPKSCDIEACKKLMRMYASMTFPKCSWNRVHFSYDVQPAIEKSLHEWQSSCGAITIR